MPVDQPPRRYREAGADASAQSPPDGLAGFAGLCLRSPAAFFVPSRDVGIIFYAAPRDRRSSIVIKARQKYFKKSSYQSLHLAQASLKEAALTFVAYQCQGALVAVVTGITVH
jgi:hypothetical protein